MLLPQCDSMGEDTSPRTPGLLEVCIARAGGPLRGGLKGTRVATFVVAWAIAEYDLGEPVTRVEDFLAYWRSGYSERSAYRHLREFRELLPEYDKPSEITPGLVEIIRRRGERPDRSDMTLVMAPVAGLT